MHHFSVEIMRLPGELSVEINTDAHPEHSNAKTQQEVPNGAFRLDQPAKYIKIWLRTEIAAAPLEGNCRRGLMDNTKPR